jgi:ABC-type multidrug transport system ATPase subunit
MYKIIIHCSTSSKIVELGEEMEIELGREPKSSFSIQINDPSVSRSHAIISAKKNQLFITDLGSTNGTWLNENRLKPNTTVLLDAKAKIGNIEISVEFNNTVGVIDNKEDLTQKFLTMQKVSGRSLNSWLQIKSEVLIGRSKECDIIIDDLSVSRKHTRVFKTGNTVYVQDLRSTNGTFINGKRIYGKEIFRAEDSLIIGLNIFRLDSDQIDLTAEKAIHAIDVSKVYSNGNVGLNPLSISLSGNQIVALMGPSGCGKSTLLKILNGENPASSGEIYIYGLELISNYELLKQKIGFVPQDDIVHAELTVDDTLYYAAKLRLGGDTSDELIFDRINSILKSLNINSPKIRQTKVGSLSGGQRKRVSIAVELLNNPKILFLDEPTSPLDPETIEEFLKCLKNLCNEGTTIVMVTHKPEDLNYVNRVIFLGTSGYHVYDGSTSEFLKHFNKSNIVEVYNLLNSEDRSKEWYKRWYNNNRSAEIARKQEVKNDAKVNAISQLYWLIMRYLHIKFSNPKNLLFLFLQPVLIATLIKLVFTNLINKNNTGELSVLFLITIGAIWFGVSNSAREIVGEKAIFRRERKFNLLLIPYITSKFIVINIISLFQIVIFIGILYLGYVKDLNNPLETLFFMMLISTTAIFFGLLLSAIAGSVEEVMSILPIALMPQIILAGILNSIKNTSTEILSYLTIGRWGTEGLARIQDHFPKTEKEPFMDVIKIRLYGNNELYKLFNGFDLNLLALGIMNLIMFMGIFFLIKSSEKRHS